MKNFKNILVTTDFSPDSHAALNEAVALAERFGSTVYLLHAVDRIEACAVDYCLSEGQVEATKEKLLREARQKLEEEIKPYSGRKGITIAADLRYGHTYDEILKEEAEKHIDLLVIGAHSKKTLWQRVRRHLTDRLTNFSYSDVLVVRHAM